VIACDDHRASTGAFEEELVDIPALWKHRRVEMRFAGTEIGGGVVAPRDLVGEDEQEEIVEGHLLLVARPCPPPARATPASSPS
jgi:hypothetical protein